MAASEPLQDRLPTEVWLRVLLHLHDADIRSLLYVKAFRTLIVSSLYRSVRRLAGLGNVEHRLHLSPMRPSAMDLVRRNLIHGGAIMARLLDEGRYIMGPELAHRFAITLRLQKYFYAKRLRDGLSKRSSRADLAQRCIITTPAAVTAALAPEAHALAFKLKCHALAKLLANRATAVSPLVVPLHTITKPSAEYPSLLSRQVIISRHIATKHMPARIARRPTADDLISRCVLKSSSSLFSFDDGDDDDDGEDETPSRLAWVREVETLLSQFLETRASPMQLHCRKVIPFDRDIVRLVCPDIKRRISYFESLGMAHQA
ncbi:hypothetical protein RI367_002528 [Sorochytrium milnesiophthora]